MVIISSSIINELENQIDNYSDSQLDKAFTTLEENQPYLNSYVEATQEIFEDEEGLYSVDDLKVRFKWT